MMNSQIDPPTEEHLSVLKTKFGHSKFRLKQWNVIDAVMNKKQDCVAIMATGHGKSICFQFGAVFTNEISIIISPLISLMIDQVTALNSANISACYLGSAQTDPNILSKVIAGNFNLVYATPEFITSTGGNFLLTRLKHKLNSIGIDEAHCVCQWGHDFRPKYRLLNSLRKIVPNVPILAVTATATESVRDDIQHSLNLVDSFMIVTGFDRPNLKFHVAAKGLSFWKDVEELLKPKSEGSTIIYVNTKYDAECFADQLNQKGLVSKPYHAGLTMEKRKHVQNLFVTDELKIVVATVAFGMGIDKSDVRTIIQYGSPSSIESYYQQVGRAGRDGKLSKCYLFHNIEDFQTHKYLRQNKHPQQVIYLEKLCENMKDFIHTETCRRLELLKYFQGELNESNFAENKNCCDNCNSSKKHKRKHENLADDEPATQMEIEIKKTIKIKVKGGRIFKTVTSNGTIKRYGKNDQRGKSATTHDTYAKSEFENGESNGWKMWEREMNESNQMIYKREGKVKIEPNAHSSKKIKIKEEQKDSKSVQRKLSDYFSITKK